MNNLCTHQVPLCEDTVYCNFFSLSDVEQSGWRQLCEEINCDIKCLAKEFIWHRDEFKVYLPEFEKDINHCLPPHLASVTCFGENIEDEWFIVYLVIELTKKHRNLVVQVKDNDGDFLLIEAANYLPDWANAETTENRVFIMGGNLHLIIPNMVSLDEELNVQMAVELLKTSNETQASSMIQNAIMSRINKFPDEIENSFHKALVNLPVHIAALLSLKPSLISPLVNAYCNADAIDGKSCQNIDFTNCLNIQVKFTKFLYAMLQHLKPIKHKSSQVIANDKGKLNGFKIACGFQIIMNSENDVFSSKPYNKFMNNLRDNGYFKENIEGSKEYERLLRTAKDYFLNTKCAVSSHVAYDISLIMNSTEYCNKIESLKSENVHTENLSEDDENWMSIHPETLNNELNSRYGNKYKFADKDEKSVQLFTSELRNFLTKSSDFEGIETEYERDNKIDFDADQFSSCVEKMLTLLNSKDDDTDDDSSCSEDKPSENSNSLEDALNEELKLKLTNNEYEALNSDKSILNNFIKSINEEKAASGPTSNLLHTIGRNKTDFLDSDDDDDY